MHTYVHVHGCFGGKCRSSSLPPAGAELPVYQSALLLSSDNTVNLFGHLDFSDSFTITQFLN